MVKEAIEKVRREMAESEDQAVEVIGEYLLEVIEENEEAAEKIIVPGKTIEGSLNEMSKIAKTKAKNGRACIGPKEGLKIVADYYGISQGAKVKVPMSEVSEVVSLEEHKKVKHQGALELNLEDLL